MNTYLIATQTINGRACNSMFIYRIDGENKEQALVNLAPKLLDGEIVISILDSLGSSVNRTGYMGRIDNVVAVEEA